MTEFIQMLLAFIVEGILIVVVLAVISTFGFVVVRGVCGLTTRCVDIKEWLTKERQ
jgi:hypothetical protein